jgi:hypothetical protein
MLAGGLILLKYLQQMFLTLKILLKMAYQLAGYFAMRLHKYIFAPPPLHHLFTISSRFNDNLLEYLEWEQPYWQEFDAHRNPAKIDNFLLKDLNLNQKEIEAWIENKYKHGKWELGNVFPDLATAYEFRNRFFSQLPNTCILSLSFLKREVQKTQQMFKTEGIYDAGRIWERFAKPILLDPNEKGKVVGYDIIGLEFGLEGLTSFLVHNMGHDIEKRFGVALNQYGLLKEEVKQEEIMNYMNATESPVEPLHWYWTQVKYYR